MLISNPSFSREKSGRLNVVVTIPVLADFVRNIGGNLVSVKSIITGLENPHTYEPRASDVKALARADLFVRVSLVLRHGQINS